MAHVEKNHRMITSATDEHNSPLAKMFSDCWTLHDFTYKRNMMMTVLQKSG